NTHHESLHVVFKAPGDAFVHPPGVGNFQLGGVGLLYGNKIVIQPAKVLRKSSHSCSAMLSIRARAFKCFSCSSATGSESTTTAPPAPILSWPSLMTIVRITTFSSAVLRWPIHPIAPEYIPRGPASRASSISKLTCLGAPVIEPPG